LGLDCHGFACFHDGKWFHFLPRPKHWALNSSTSFTQCPYRK
jgi:hypothetical protein